MDGNLPEYIETNEEVKVWEDFLNTIPKEEIVGFLLDRMVADTKFFGYVKNRFTEPDNDGDIEGVLKVFDNEVYLEYKNAVVDTEYVIDFARRIVELIDGMNNEASKKEGYEHIIRVITDGYKNYGLGWPDDDQTVDYFLQEIGSSLCYT